jgi:hypothetical protein
MLSARPIAQPEIGAPPSSSSPNASVAPVPTSNAGPDLGSLQEDIGSVLVVSWQGTEISPSLRSLLDDGRVGGVLLFASNFNGPQGLRALSDALQTIASTACLDHPILVMLATAVYVSGLGGGDVPAMFSAPVVGRLRTQLGFGGAIISDSVSGRHRRPVFAARSDGARPGRRQRYGAARQRRSRLRRGRDGGGPRGGPLRAPGPRRPARVGDEGQPPARHLGQEVRALPGGDGSLAARQTGQGMICPLAERE